MASERADAEPGNGVSPQPRHPSDLVFVGLSRQVAALNRDTGELIWKWKARKGSGFAVILCDGDRLIVSVQGDTYGLDPATGNELWSNRLKGMGMGIPCLASISGSSNPAIIGEADAQAQAAAGGGS